MIRLVAIAALLVGCTQATTEPTAPDAGAAVDCGPRPVMPAVTSAWISFANADGTIADHLVFSDVDGRALVQWTRLVDIWGQCIESKIAR